VITLTATITPTGTNGNIIFKDGTSILSTVAIVSSVATFKTGSLAIGSRNITAYFLLFGNSKDSISNSKSITINSGSGHDGATTLYLAPTPASTSDTLALTATIKSSNGGNPTGFVWFVDLSTPQQFSTKVTPNTSGVATFSFVNCTAGLKAITAYYEGNMQYNPNNDTRTIQIYVPASLSLTTSTTTASVGDSITLTANLSYGGTGPVGNIVFKNGVNILAVLPLPTGTIKFVQFTTSGFGAGSQSITAQYLSTGNHQNALSNSVSITINQVSTTTTIQTSTTSAFNGDSIILTANVTAAGAVGPPTGQVVFKDGFTTIGNVSLQTGNLIKGYAKLSISSLATGSHNNITAQFTGERFFANSVSGAISINIS